MDSSVHQNDIIIQDIVIIVPPVRTAGEFGYPNQDPSERDRLFSHIESLVDHVARIHRWKNCLQGSNQLVTDKKNRITRLVTNEFSFYTRKPFTISEFQAFQEKISALASKQPENLHLVLASFAVRTPSDNVMNVVAYIECGQNSKVRFIVKNNPDVRDPYYTEEGIWKKKVLFNLGLARPSEYTRSLIQVSSLNTFPKMKIGNQVCEFSYNNMFTCETAGKQELTIYVDICADHLADVSRKKLHDVLEKGAKDTLQGIQTRRFPTQYSRVVVSNTIDKSIPWVHDESIIFADPDYSLQIYNSKIAPIQGYFGRPFVIIDTIPRSCNSEYPVEYKGFINVINKCMDFDAVAQRLQQLLLEIHSSNAEYLLDGVNENLVNEAAEYIFFITHIINSREIPAWFLNPTNIAQLKAWSNNPKFRYLGANKRLEKSILTLDGKLKAAAQKRQLELARQIEVAAEETAQVRQAARYASYACENVQWYNEFNPEFG